MQLGLRFAAAKLPGLRTGRVVGNLAERSWSLGGQRNRTVDPGLSYLQTADPLYNKERQRSGAIAIYASRKPWFGQPCAAQVE